MNTTDYFTNINAMFLFCIFTCGLLVWAVLWGLNTKNRLNKRLIDICRKLNLEMLDNTERIRKYEELFKQYIERGKRIIALEVAKDNAEKESGDLRKQLTESESQANGYKAEFIAVSNELEVTKAKVRKRDANGKFLPSGNGCVRTPKKLKLVTDLGENEVIHCKTPEQRLAIRTLMHEAGMKTVFGRLYITDDIGSRLGNSLCYRPKDGIYNTIESYDERNLTIHPASDFIAKPKRVKKVKAESHKLVHGLTVKNPTEDEAKMIFDEARRLGYDCEDVLSVNKSFPWIWYSQEGLICSCIADAHDSDIYVTAKEFVQRMQNGRG